MACACLAKPFLVVVNIFLVLIGLALLSTGIILEVSPDLVTDYIDPFLEKLPEIAESAGLNSVSQEVDHASDLDSTSNLYSSAAIVLIVLGSVIAVLGLLGWWGSCCRVKCLLVLYMCLVGLLVVAKLVILILLLFGVFSDDIKDEIQKTIDKSYGGIDDVSSLESVVFNYIMIEFECCGIDDYKDFNSSEKWEREREVAFYGTVVILKTPFACCKFEGDLPDVEVEDPQCAVEPMGNNSNYDKGCWKAVGERIETEEAIVFAVYAAILFFETLCIVFAAIIYCDLEKQEK